MKAPPCYAKAVCRARDLITELHIETPAEILIEKIAPFKKAPIRYAPLTGCDGRMVRTGDQALITVRSTVERLGRKRLIIAHELGHVLLHPEIRQIDEVDVRQTRNFNHYQAPEELEANYFAAELLMPARFFTKQAQQCEPAWDSIRSLADAYKTTLTSAAIQFVHCTRESVILVASERGDRKWFVFGDTTDGFLITDVQRIHRYTCAHELLAENKTHSRAQTIPAGAWFRNFDPNGKECITEDAIRATGSDFVLSLLWIHDDI